MELSELKYKKLQIYYFSGTGNAEFAANEIAKLSKQKGVKAKVINIAEDDFCFSEINDDKLIGFCYPTHGFNVPPIILKFLSRFPKGRSDVFLLNTRAGMKLFKLQTPGLGGLALWLPALILRLKGYKTRGFRPLDMPSNWITIHPGLIRSAVGFLAGKCMKTLSRFTEQILAGKRVLAGLFWLPIDIFLFPISVGYYLFGRFVLAKTLFASYQCNNCGKCILECPVNAISMKNERPYWSFKCESCMKCINNCPNRAIESSLGINAVIWWLVFSLVPYSLITFLVSHQVISKSFYIQYSRPAFYIIMAVSGFALLFSGYWILHQLLRVKWINRVITFTSLTRFKWWNRYSYKSGK
ncbi:MAG: EFR1 family ferrodoxin [Acidobacteriota bacterium]